MVRSDTSWRRGGLDGMSVKAFNGAQSFKYKII